MLGGVRSQSQQLGGTRDVSLGSSHNKSSDGDLCSGRPFGVPPLKKLCFGIEYVGDDLADVKSRTLAAPTRIWAGTLFESRVLRRLTVADLIVGRGRSARLSIRCSPQEGLLR